MDERKIKHRVRNIVAQVLRIPEGDIDDNADFSWDLGADSVNRIEIVSMIEEEFEIELDEDEALSHDTVAEASRLIRRVLDTHNHK